MITKEYKIDEVFKHEGKVLQVVSWLPPACNDCGAGRAKDCAGNMFCLARERKDNTSIYYKAITEPAEGMLYRTDDGKLWRFQAAETPPKDSYCTGPGNCQGFTREVFGKPEDTMSMWYRKNFHWVLVPEAAKKEPGRHITLSSALHKDGEVLFHINEQTHIGSAFTPTGSTFISLGGVQLQSSVNPCKMWLPCGGVGMWVRGSNISSDEGAIRVSEREYAQILEAVKEYNETGGVGYSKPAELKQEDTKVTEEKRYIELKILKTTDAGVTFRIEKQTHREPTKQFKSRNGIWLISLGCPEYDDNLTRLFLRGIDALNDLRELTVTHVVYSRIAEAVQEYNETNGDGYKRDPYEWLKNGVTYYYPNIGQNKVEPLRMKGASVDRRNKEANMIFRTEAQAKEALTRLRKTLSDYQAELADEEAGLDLF